jgi:acylphosphatase
MAIVCKRVLYSGSIQGVGFRYTARSIAAGYAVSGYVRNLADGRVELIGEGMAAELRAFLDAIRDRWTDFITDTVETDAAPQRLAGFTIRH